MALSPNAKKELRQEITAYCRAAEAAEARWHYTQSRPFHGYGRDPRTYFYADCSAYCSLVMYAAGRNSGHPVADPLGMHYSGWGYTGTALEFLDAHRAPEDKYRIGDMAIYGTRSNTVHIVICRKAGSSESAVWSSFGQESGPEGRQPLGYHPSPVVGVYRHPALL